MSLRRSGRRASASTVSTRLTTTRPQTSAGTPYSRRQEWGSSCSQTTINTSSMRWGYEGVFLWCRSPVEGYDLEKPNSYILYLDANNLYGSLLPTGTFRLKEDYESLDESIFSHAADSPEGLILEVDVKYPRELHNAHNAYPLAPERMVVQKEWMSDYQQDLLGVGVAPAEVEKLVPNLRNKERYVLHYRILQLDFSLSMRLAKIHRTLRIRQSPWRELFIRMNT